MVTVQSSDFKIKKGQEHLRLYQWNSLIARHYFCDVCGIYVYHQRRTDPSLLSVNACCVDNLIVASVPVRKVDGQKRSLETGPSS